MKEKRPIRNVPVAKIARVLNVSEATVRRAAQAIEDALRGK